MKFPSRSLLALLLVAGATLACTESPTTTTSTSRLSPQAVHPTFAKVKATDSTLFLTDVAYSDTALVLKRNTSLKQNVSASAVIGSKGGSIRIDAAGVQITFPAGALNQDTLITVTAFKGSDVAYDFQPHGLVFGKPVMIQQSLAGTWVETYPQLLTGLHGAYYDTDLASAFVDAGKYFAKIKENQLGYTDDPSQVRFYVGHFSGYLVSCGFY
jgi:hypothetical protein